MRIVVIHHLTLDGVTQAPGLPDEDLRGGFQYGGWEPPYGDAVMANALGFGAANARRPDAAIRADLLRRLGRLSEAAAAYDAAIARSTNAIEREFLRRSRCALPPT